MDDLKHRMKEWWEYDPGHLISQAADRIEKLEQRLQVTCEREAATTARYDTRIEALESQVRAADALAEQVQRVKDFRYDPNIGIELNRLEEALTAYRATKEGGAL